LWLPHESGNLSEAPRAPQNNSVVSVYDFISVQPFLNCNGRKYAPLRKISAPVRVLRQSLHFSKSLARDDNFIHRNDLKFARKHIAKDLNAMDPRELTTALGKEGAQKLVGAVNLAAKEGWATGKAMAAIRFALSAAGFGAIGHFI
jgi:hypothetical protein